MQIQGKIEGFLESVGAIFKGEDQIPWCNPDVVSGCEKEVAEASDEQKAESIMRFSWALVHSTQPDDVQRGIAMLEASLANANSPLQKKEKLYLLAVGYYRAADYSRSRQLVEQCLQIEPDWRQALFLKNTIQDRITKDGAIGIGITATVVGLVGGGVSAALSRKKNKNLILSICGAKVSQKRYSCHLQSEVLSELKSSQVPTLSDIVTIHFNIGDFEY